jgi:hypothetical protein
MHTLNFPAIPAEAVSEKLTHFPMHLHEGTGLFLCD